MSKRLAMFIVSAVVCVFAGAAFAQGSKIHPNPPVPAVMHTAPAQTAAHQKVPGTVSVVLLKGWEGLCEGGCDTLWTDLATNWQNYGTIPLTVDYSTYVDTDFTYQDLVNSGADVIVISDPSGGEQTYSSAEISAVQQYVAAGHIAIGTYLVFDYSTYNNLGLAPIFGFTSSQTYTATAISNVFDKKTNTSCLFTKISGSSWTSTGYPESQTPTSGIWSKSDVNHQNPLPSLDAYSDSGVGIITMRLHGAAGAIFISNFPEYGSVGSVDEQLLYNASTCYVAQ